MLDQAAKLLRDHGEPSVTTRAVTKAVGVSQPTFYAHFDNIEALRLEAYDQLATELVGFTREAQEVLRARGPSDPRALGQHYREVLRKMEENGPALRMHLRHRWASSRLGELCRRVDDELRQAIVEHLELVVEETQSDRGVTLSRLARVLYERILGADVLASEGVPMDQLAELLALETLCAAQVFLASDEG